MAIAPVIINLQVGGIADVGKALKSVEQALTNLEKRRTQLAQNTSKVVDKATRDEVNSVEKGARAKIAAEQKYERTAGLAMGKLAQETEKYERAKTRTVEQETRRRQNAVAKQTADELRLRKDAHDKMSRMSGRAGNLVAGGVTRGLSAASGFATATLGVMGGFGIADAVRSRAMESGQAAGIALSGSKTGGKKFTSGQVLKSATAVGVESGLGVQDALEGLEVFTAKTGELQVGMDILKDIAMYADASGTSLHDMSSASAELFSSGTVSNGEELKAILGSLIEMGKDGAVEIKDLAAGFGRITASAGQFIGDKSKNVKTLTAFAEMSKKYAAASPREALTSVQNLASDIAKHRESFAALGDAHAGRGRRHKGPAGVEILDAGGKFLRDPLEILHDAMIKTGGLSVPQQHKLFGERSFRAIAGASEIFNKSKAGGSTDEEAWAKVMKEFTELTSAMMTPEQAQKAALERRAEADRKMAQTMEDLRAKVGDQLLPAVIRISGEMTKLTPSIVDFASGLGKLAQIFTEHPWAGLGAVVGAFIVKELAIAGIGAAVRSAITAAGTNLATGAGGGKVGGPGGAAVTTAALLAAGAGISGGASVGMQTSDVVNATNAASSNTMETVANLATKIRSGKATPAEKQAALDLVNSTKAKLGAASKVETGTMASLNAGTSAAWEGAANAVITPFGIPELKGAHKKAADITEATVLKQQSSGLESAIKNLTQALTSNTNAKGEQRTGEGASGASLAKRGGTQ